MLPFWIATLTLFLVLVLGIYAWSTAVREVVEQLREDVKSQQLRIAALEERAAVLEKRKQSVSGLLPVTISVLAEKPMLTFDDDEETRVSAPKSESILLVPADVAERK